MSARESAPSPPAWHLYVPKLVSVLRRGYTREDFGRDVFAGLTVAVVALPLAMALAIASGTTPEKGLHTAIVAGFLISALGGSRVQVGGPTAAFIPVVFAVIAEFGYGGMILCTLLAGLMLVAAGLLRLGALMKYIPRPVVTGFTAGIAVSIFSSQVRDLLGLRMSEVPAEFLARWRAYADALPTFTPAALALALASLAAIVLLKRTRPTAPAFLVVVVLASLAVVAGLPVESIGTRFPGGIPATLPQFHFPHIPFERTFELLPASFTIAFLAGVESLLSAVVADGMIGGRHRSNCELVAQGVANAASALCGGLPATGAIARTATNVRAGARSPVAGMLHAVFLLVFMLVAAPLMRHVPLAALAAILLVVAWNMAEVEAFRHLLRGPWGDRIVLLVTFALTITVDLTIAIQVGVVLAAFLFMHRMAEVVEIRTHVKLIEEDVADDVRAVPPPDQRAQLPAGVEVFRISGPLFFAVANRLDDVLDTLQQRPRIFILRTREVPLIDASGVAALEQFLSRCERMGIRVIVSGLQPQPRTVLEQMGVLAHPAIAALASGFDEAIARARDLVARA